jgi:hypothetical protein
MGAQQSVSVTPVATEKVSFTVVNNTEKEISIKVGKISFKAGKNTTSTLNKLNVDDNGIVIYDSNGSEIESVSKSVLMSQANPIIYVKPSVQVLSGSSLLPVPDEPTPTGYVSRPTINVTPVPTKK